MSYVSESLVTPHVSIKLLLTQSDERLVRMAAAGHDRAFEAIVDRYRRQLLRYAERFPAAGPAEDVVQAAFVRAWGALRDGTEVRDLRPWLYRIVHNTALNAARREPGADAELVESEALGVGPVEETEIQDDLRRTLDGIAALPGRQRDALVAVAVDGRAHADVGRELGITEPAVRQLVHRARASVRAVASALTPYPLIAWISEIGTTQAASVTRIGELVGGAGAGAAVIKLGAVAATTGAIVAGAPAVHHAVHHALRTPTATVASAGTASASGRAATSPPGRSAKSEVTGHGGASGRSHGSRRADGAPTRPAGRLRVSERRHAPTTAADDGEQRSAAGRTTTPEAAAHGRHHSEGEPVEPADSATTAGSDPAEPDSHERSGAPEIDAASSAAPEEPAGSSDGPQAPEMSGTPDGATGPSGPR